jgi:hypothetical protein
MNTMKKSILAAAVPLALAVAAPAISQTTPPAPAAPPAAGAPADAALSEPEIRSALESQGYSNIRTIKHDGDQYQMQAQHDGKPVVLMVDARSGRYSERPS